MQVYSLDIDTWKWAEHTPDVSGDAPSPRYGHTAVALPDERHIVTFGGGDADDDMFYSSIAVLDTYTWHWSTPKIQASLRLCMQSCMLGQMMCFCLPCNEGRLESYACLTGCISIQPVSSVSLLGTT